MLYFYFCTEHWNKNNFPTGINKVFWIWIWKANVYLVHLPQQEVPKIEPKFQDVTEDQFLKKTLSWPQWPSAHWLRPYNLNLPLLSFSHHPSIHPSIFFRLSGTGSRGQLPEQGHPDLPLPGYCLQLFSHFCCKVSVYLNIRTNDLSIYHKRKWPNLDLKFREVVEDQLLHI